MNRIRDIIKAHAKGGRVREPTRRNHTFHLNEENIKQLRAYCVSKGIPVSKVVDEIIEAFLEEANEAGELPLDHSQTE